jgi:hypothetical protein
MCVKESKSPVPTSMEILSNKNLISPTNKFNKLNIEVYFKNQKRNSQPWDADEQTLTIAGENQMAAPWFGF